jgi:hypothetical protein
LFVAVQGGGYTLENSDQIDVLVTHCLLLFF